MQKKQILKAGFAAVATAALLTACPPSTPNTVESPEPTESESPEPTESESPEPAESESPEPAESESPEPAESESPEPAESESPEPAESESPEPTAEPTAEATSDISVVEKTTVNGDVYDDTGAPVEGGKVSIKSLSSGVEFTANTDLLGGTYSFNNVPAGVQLEIEVTKAGHTTRRRVVVAKSNKQGDPDANKYDFGKLDDAGNPDKRTAVSDKPEVVMVTPKRNASGISPDTSFVLKFSEPVDTDTIEDNFGVWSATDELLTVNEAYGGLVTEDLTFEGVGGDGDDKDALGDHMDDGDAVSTLVWDDSVFDIDWNGDDTEVTFTFEDEQMLPTDTETENVPDYLVTLQGVDDGQIKDKAGITRKSEYFKLTEGHHEEYFKFSIQTDDEDPTVENIEALTGENGNSEGDQIEVEFSEPMVWYTEAGEIRGNMLYQAGEGSENENPIDANNYYITVVRAGSTEISDVAWYEIDGDNTGYATFDTSDATHKTVLLTLWDDADDIYMPGDKVTVRVASTVLDPAGNSVDSAEDEDSDVAS